jgi:predicted ABC-class ATPase
LKQLEIKILKLKKAHYGRYRSLQNTYTQFDTIYELSHAQGDPYAGYSRLNIRFKLKDYEYPEHLWNEAIKTDALADYMLRVLTPLVQEYSESRGTGNSGQYRLLKPAQECLKRTALRIVNGEVEIRLGLGLPSDQREVNVELATQMFLIEVPGMINQLRMRNLSLKHVEKHVDCIFRQEKMRELLAEKGWVAFVREGSRLPRESGASDKPLPEAESFKIPANMLETWDLPWGQEKGLAIGKGLTLITGGAFHGKSTLLQAVLSGVYNHIPGDGREGIVTEASALSIAVEEGRPVYDIDMSPFFTAIPSADPTHFKTQNASGSTSQAATLLEALSLGARTLCMDEDRSAVNFLVRDQLMRELIASKEEPLIPLMDKIGGWKKDLSLILVSGSSGEYLPWVDRVIVMNHFQPEDRTELAKAIVNRSNLVFPEVSEEKLPSAQIGVEWTQALKVPTTNKVKFKSMGQTCSSGRIETSANGFYHLKSEGQKLGLAWGMEWVLYLYPQFEGKDLNFILEQMSQFWNKGEWDLNHIVLGGDIEVPRLIDVGLAILKSRKSN